MSAGIRNPASVTPLAKSRLLTSGLHLDSDHVAGDGRRERQPDAELLVGHLNLSAVAADRRHGNLAAGEEARFLAVVRNQVRLGEALEEAAAFERA